MHPTPFRPASGGVLFLPGGLPVMSLFAIVVLAFSMSADAFAAALGKGSVLDRPRLGEALRIGLVFGTVEAITPVIGWAGGLAASAYITAIDHWIAFALLAGIGGKMIWDGARRPAEGGKPARHSLGLLLMTAIGTSIDAMAVGVTLAFLAADIVVTALAIGLATFLMTTIGIMIGRVIGERLGRVAEALGGVCLILIGSKILIEHTMLH
jgi:putative Mn2+ efflux pump MntP